MLGGGGEGTVEIIRLVFSSTLKSFRVNRFLVIMFSITVLITRFFIAEFTRWVDLVPKKEKFCAAELIFSLVELD